MHVLYLIDSVGAPGGAEQSLALLAPEYRRQGVHVDVATLHDRPGHQAALVAGGADLFVLEGTTRRAWFQATRRLIGERRPDLVHTTLFDANLVGRAAARSRGVPVVSSLVSSTYGAEHFANPSLSSWKLRAAWTMDAVTAHMTVRMHAVSRYVADTMAKRLRFPRERIDVVPRGRSTGGLGTRSRQRRAAARRKLYLADEVPLLLAVARQEHPKALDVGVRALSVVRRERPDTMLFLAGSAGAETPDLEALVAAEGMGDAVRFLGARTDVAELLCAADVFVLPSRREGMPGALLEAMALEAPAVVSDIPQNREVVDETMAFLAPVDDPGALAHAVLDALNNPEDARSRAVRAKARFLSEFTIERVAERMVDFYQQAVSS